MGKAGKLSHNERKHFFDVVVFIALKYILIDPENIVSR